MFSPYLAFPNNGREMLAYYAEVFGGTVETRGYDDNVKAYLDFPIPDDALAHGTLTGGLVTLAGGDAVMPGDTPKLNEHTYSFMLQLDSIAEAQRLIQRLVDDGGSQPMPFDQAPWGDHYGQVIDKYGLLWHFNVES